MRMIDTFAKDGFKVTIFQTEDRYLLQLEDESYMLSWKIDKEIALNEVKEKATDLLLNQAKGLWPTLRKNLYMTHKNKNEANNFPNII